MKKLVMNGLVPLLVICVFTAACSSRSKEQKALKAIRTAMVDQQVNDAEFASALAFVQKAGTVTVNDAGVRTPIHNEEELALYFIGRGITEPAAMLKKYVKNTIPLERLVVMLENSMSMQGYFKSGTSTFTRPVIALYNGVTKEVSIETAYIGENAKHTEAELTAVEKDKFDSNLATGKVLVGHSSPLDQIFVKAIAMAADNVPTISCVITDGIISGTSQETKKDPEFTLKHLPLIEQRIRDAVSSEEKVGFLVYRFDGEFTGDYYDYHNKTHKLKEATRPFFIFLFGSADHLTEFAQKVEKEPNFRFTDRLASYEAGGYQTLTKGQLMASQNTEKVSIVPAQNSVIIPTRIMAPVNFRLKMSVRNLPAFVNDEHYLQSNLSFQYKDASSGIPLPAEGFLQGLHEENPALGTYILDLQVSPDLAAKFGQNMEISISLGGILDDWYLNKSCADDTVAGGNDEDTFCLDALVRAMLMGKGIMPDNLKAAIEIPVKIVKK